MSRLRASAYEVLTINKEGKSVDITGVDSDGPITTSFDYYESLLSPTFTATLSFSDSGGSVNYSSEYDRQEPLGTVFNAFPLIGGEKIKVKISSQYQYSAFDFTSDDKLFINRYPVQVGKDPTREVTILNLTSIYDQKAGQTLIKNTLRGKISDIVVQMLKDKFEVECDVDSTKNSIETQGGSVPIFDKIINLARQSIPENGYPGYFFYQTQDGFKFHSIDYLISQTPVAKYYYTSVLKANVCNDINDFKIIKYSVSNNQNVVKASNQGVDSSYCITYDSKSQEVVYSPVDNESTIHLGGNPRINISPELETSFQDKRCFLSVADNGSNSKDVNGRSNNPAQNWEPQSVMRYVSLFTQELNIQVPCNIGLKVGDVIECDFERISKSNKASDSTDPVQSGKYLIVNLCHHFDTKYSITSMTIVRDTYGKYHSSSSPILTIPFKQ